MQQPQTSQIHFLPREFSSFQIPLCSTHPCTHTHASSNLWNWANWFQCELFYREEICLATEEEDDEKQKERGKSTIMKSISPTHEFHSCDLRSNFFFKFFFASRGLSYLHPRRREREERGRRKGSIEEGQSVEGQTATTTEQQLLQQPWSKSCRARTHQSQWLHLQSTWQLWSYLSPQQIVSCCHWSSPQCPVWLPSSHKSTHSLLPWWWSLHCNCNPQNKQPNTTTQHNTIQQTQQQPTTTTSLPLPLPLPPLTKPSSQHNNLSPKIAQKQNNLFAQNCPKARQSFLPKIAHKQDNPFSPKLHKNNNLFPEFYVMSSTHSLTHTHTQFTQSFFFTHTHPFSGLYLVLYPTLLLVLYVHKQASFFPLLSLSLSHASLSPPPSLSLSCCTTHFLLFPSIPFPSLVSFATLPN